MATYLMFGKLSTEAAKLIRERSMQVSAALTGLPGISFRAAPALTIDQFRKLAAA